MKKPAFIIAAASSGSGKTTLTLGIVAALAKRGLDVRCFKCGPDFIDPTLHRLMSGRTSYNLDLRMMGAGCCRRTFVEKSDGGDVIVVEGVMGLFDGDEASTASLAKALGLPVLLVIDARSMAQSAAAVLSGFLSYDPELVISGVIFNRIGSPRHQNLIDQAVRQRCAIGFCGYFGRDARHLIPERHLGLHMGDEKPLGTDGHLILADAIESQINLDLLLGAVGVDASTLTVAAAGAQTDVKRGAARKVRLGVAMDAAFCFYYPQNLELFEASGFEIVYFSPLHDSRLPPAVDMLYFGGGYPENHAAVLSANEGMRNDILDHHRGNIPIYAECGGFMYLCRSLADMDGQVHQMVSIFPCDTAMNDRLRKLGYRRATLQRDCLLGSRGDTLHGHEFHYSEIVSRPSDGEQAAPLYLLDNNSQEGYSVGAALGSYVHLHFAGTRSAIDRIYRQLAGTDRETHGHD